MNEYALLILNLFFSIESLSFKKLLILEHYTLMSKHSLKLTMLTFVTLKQE